MKNPILLCLYLFPMCWIHGQSTTEKTSISIAYFSQFGIEPGVKISADFNLKQWTTQASAIKLKSLFISPQIGFFVRPENNSNLLLSTEIGIRRQKEGRASFAAFSLGLGYLNQFQTTNLSIQLGDGSQSASRDNIAYFLPTINYTFGNQLVTIIDWYAKIGLGQRIDGGIGSSTIALIEVGLQFSL